MSVRKALPGAQGAPDAPTPLARRLAAQIRATGPMRLADYMAACLFDPEHGYYTNAQVFGAAGDFVTAPEISQMFGELIGLALAQAWRDQGSPARLVLAELGPGRGTLMADALRAVRVVPGFLEAAELVLVEASPRLREVQARTLAPTGLTPRWVDDVGALPEGPLFLVANEFFDALPIRQFVATESGWAERVVGLDPQGRLAPGLVALPPAADMPHAAPGTVVERRPAAAPIMAAIAERIGHHGGAGILIDYGGEGGIGDTFQALRAHAPVDPFAEPGLADLTAHVDFAALAEAARAAGGPVAVAGPLEQRAFLAALGIEARAQALAARLSGAALQAHIAAFRRLTAAEEMGTLFKVLGLRPADAPPLAGIG